MNLPESRTIPALLDEMARRYPDRPFAVDANSRVTYSEFRALARAMAKNLYALGIRPGDKVALLMENRLEWLVVDFATHLLGAVFVAMNTWWRRSELHHALVLSDTKLLITQDRFGKIDYLAELDAAGDRASAFPILEHIVVLGENSLPGSMSFDHLTRLGTDIPDSLLDSIAPTIAPDDVCMILFTSGSTGRSKAALLVHRGTIENPFGIGERMHLTEQDRVLLVLSLFWSASCCNALFNVFGHGACIVLQRQFEPGEALALIEQERISAMYTTPNIVHALYNHPDRHTRDLTSLRTGNCRPETVDLLAEMGAPDFCCTYGLTEGYGQSVVADRFWPIELRRQGIGFPNPNTELQIVDPATHAPLPHGEIGEVRVRGYVMKGYYKDAEQTAKAIDAEGWLYTGDLGVFDDTNGFRFPRPQQGTHQDRRHQRHPRRSGNPAAPASRRAASHGRRPARPRTRRNRRRLDRAQAGRDAHRTGAGDVLPGKRCRL